MILRVIDNLDIPSQENQENFDLLIDRIRNEQCAVFIGAGLSKPVGYPSLQELLWNMAAVAEIDTLLDKIITTEWMDDFQEIKETLGEDRYRACLHEIFDHEARDIEFNPILLYLLYVPFRAYITTNYDPCLEFASRHLTSSRIRNNFAYPNLLATDLKNNHIFHIHGYINPDEHDSVNSMVLSRDEYNDAYENSGIVSNFLRTLFSEIDVAFIGFGWNDLVILDIIKRVKEAREVREDIATSRNMRLTRKRDKFTIIDSESFERDKEGNNFLGINGIRPIIYEKKAESHSQINKIIKVLQEKTSNIPMGPMPSFPEGLIKDGDGHE